MSEPPEKSAARGKSCRAKARGKTGAWDRVPPSGEKADPATHSYHIAFAGESVRSRRAALDDNKKKSEWHKSCLMTGRVQLFAKEACSC